MFKGDHKPPGMWLCRRVIRGLGFKLADRASHGEPSQVYIDSASSSMTQYDPGFCCHGGLTVGLYREDGKRKWKLLLRVWGLGDI